MGRGIGGRSRRVEELETRLIAGGPHAEGEVLDVLGAEGGAAEPPTEKRAAAAKERLSHHHRMTLSPFQKYKLYKRFPFKFLFQSGTIIAITIFFTVVSLLHSRVSAAPPRPVPSIHDTIGSAC